MPKISLSERPVGFEAQDLKTQSDRWDQNLHQDYLNLDGVEETASEDDLNLDGVHHREALTDDNDVTPWDGGADVDWT